MDNNNNQLQPKKFKKITLAIVIPAVVVIAAAVLFFFYNNTEKSSAKPVNKEISSLSEENNKTTQITQQKTTSPKFTDTQTKTASAAANVISTTSAPQTSLPIQNYSDTRNHLYGEILNNILVNNETPSGNQLFSLEGNSFSICDIDGDGREELIVLCSQTAAVGMECVIYGCSEKGELTEQLTCFPAVTFYDNGIITVDAARTQSVAGDFWPYSVFRYDSVSDKYVRLANVSAWDVKNYPTDFDGNDRSVYDKSGSGYVYSVIEDSAKDNPMDKTDFDSWHDSVFGSAKTVDIHEKQISAENILEIAPEFRY